MASHVSKLKYPLKYGETEGTFICITATHFRISKIDLIESVEFHLQMHELCTQGHTLLHTNSHAAHTVWVRPATYCGTVVQYAS